MQRWCSRTGPCCAPERRERVPGKKPWNTRARVHFHNRVPRKQRGRCIRTPIGLVQGGTCSGRWQRARPVRWLLSDDVRAAGYCATCGWWMAPARRRNAPTWRDRIDRIGRVLEGKARGLRVVDGGAACWRRASSTCTRWRSADRIVRAVPCNGRDHAMGVTTVLSRPVAPTERVTGHRRIPYGECLNGAGECRGVVLCQGCLSSCSPYLLQRRQLCFSVARKRVRHPCLKWENPGRYWSAAGVSALLVYLLSQVRGGSNGCR